MFLNANYIWNDSAHDYIQMELQFESYSLWRKVHVYQVSCI